MAVSVCVSFSVSPSLAVPVPVCLCVCVKINLKKAGDGNRVGERAREEGVNSLTDVFYGIFAGILLVWLSEFLLISLGLEANLQA